MATADGGGRSKSVKVELFPPPPKLCIEPKVELIEFKYPTETKLYLPKVFWHGSEVELNALLEEKFSPFGLLYQVTSKSKQRGEDEYYAYVTFYSKSSAGRARIMLDKNLLISGKPCGVQQGKSNLKNHPLLYQPLAKDKCVELANFYLGFNGWNTQVMYHQVEEVSEAPFSIKYGSAVRLTIKSNFLNNGDKSSLCGGDGGHLSVDGVGLSDDEPLTHKSKGQAMSYAGKCSLNAALRNAFSRIILVIVNDSKVRVTVNTAVKEPFAYNPLWYNRPGVTVNQVDYDDEEEDFDNDPNFDEAVKAMDC